jgi:hypothetical protein
MTTAEMDMEAVRKEEEEKVRGFLRIGEFIFWFSQLEFTIKVRLSKALNLPDELFHTVTAPYDFAVLCTVTKNVLIHRYTEKKDTVAITKVFNACAALNVQRVRVAHGMWTHGQDGLIATHAPRGTLQRSYFYEKPGELSGLTEKAKQLMLQVLDVPMKAKPGRGAVERIGIEFLPDERPPQTAPQSRAPSKPRRPA